MRKFCWLILFTFLSTAFAGAQTLRAYERAADDAYKIKDYYAALTYYEVVLEASENRVDVFYKYANAARLFNALPLAEIYYEKVQNSETADQYTEANFWLATVKQQLGKYGEAKSLYQKFISAADYNGQYLAEAKKGTGECDWAIEVLAVPKEGYEIKLLGEEVNSVFSEFAPVEVGDTLYYSSLRFNNEEDVHEPPRQISKLMYQVKDEVASIVNDINKDQVLTGHTTFNRAGNKMYYTICAYSQTGDIPCRIYESEKNADGSWSKGKKLSESINKTVSTATQPNIGQDLEGNEVLYFVSDRVGGKGGLDIWYAPIKGNGFGTPMNLTKVNTEKDDITPFWHAASQKLYFSSKGYQTLGGFDIYESKIVNKEWQTPTHLGAPLNTSYDDLYFSVDERNSKGYLSSNRPGARYIEESKSACCNDIFEVDIMPLQIAVKLLLFDAETKLEITSATIDFVQMPGQLLFSRINKLGNDFQFDVGLDKNYSFKANHPDYLSDTVMVSTIGWEQSDTLTREIFLSRKPQTPSNPLNLNALVFDASTKLPLLGASVEVIDVKNNTRQSKINELDNDFQFGMMGNHTYTILVERPGYEPENLTFTTEDISDNYTFIKKFYLVPLPLGPVDKSVLASYLPLPIYFDNDSPNSGSRQANTRVNYMDIAPGYYGRKGEFTNFYTQGLAGIQKVEEENRIDAFFDHEVNRGTRILKSFTARLLIYLKAGNTAELRIKGYASPRAEDDYNLQLTKRRIHSLINYMRSFDNGALLPYLNNGQLVVSQQPFGEALAPEDVSDDMNDLRNSIYSISASKERRVEIVEIN